jgi:hypothetical protein
MCPDTRNDYSDTRNDYSDTRSDYSDTRNHYPYSPATVGKCIKYVTGNQTLRSLCLARNDGAKTGRLLAG